MALVVASSFATVLPQIMGSKKGDDSRLTLPCASKYSDWLNNTEGIPTGVKPRILEGLETQRDTYGEVIRGLEYSHPVGAKVAAQLLQKSIEFAGILLGVIDSMWTEYAARGSEVQPAESWLIICAVVRQLFRELRNVRRPGASCVPGSAASIGATWWYVLQTHRVMEEFTTIGIRRHPSIIPVFTSHLDRYRVSKSTHGTLASQVKKLETSVSSLNTQVQKLNGARGNAGGRRGGGTAEVTDPNAPGFIP